MPDRHEFPDWLIRIMSIRREFADEEKAIPNGSAQLQSFR
jgi:hypothetical protein